MYWLISSVYLNKLPLSQSSVSPLQTNSLSTSKDLSRIRGSYPFFVTKNSVNNWYSSRTIGPMLYLKSIKLKHLIGYFDLLLLQGYDNPVIIIIE